MVPTQPVTAPACPHAGLAQDFQPFDLTDPFGFYARAREETAIFHSPEIDYWVVTRYADIRDIFRDPATFSSENTQAPYRPRPPEVQRILDEGGFSVVTGLSGKQPPDHTRLRGFVKKAFTPRRVASLEPEIRAITTEMIDRFAGRGHADLVTELAFELPALVIFRMLGVPAEEVPKVKAWAQSRVAMNFGDAPLEEQMHHAENLVRYWRYCQDLVRSRLEHPQDDLPGALAALYASGEEEIELDEIAGLVYGQLTAGHETTTALLSNGLKELLADRGAWDAICADPARIPAAVEELLRLSAPVFTWKRRTTRPATVGGVTLPAGTNLLLLLGSANHDPTVFPDPDRIDLDRDNASRHLSFGLGIHFCLGAPLARLEARVVLEELTRRLPTLRLTPGQHFDYSANSSFRGPAHVLAEWDVDSARVPTLTFAECPDDPALVGGKAASLASLTRAGLPVPDGFVVTTAAFDAALGGVAAERLAREARALRDAPLAELERGAAELRELIQRAPLPDGLEDAIRAAYARLGDDAPVAVRSSATAEDSADTSFAGQQDTYLWVVGADAVVEHLRRCWSSLYSARSLAYRRDHGVDEGVRMAVVVQRMVDADVAGVAMTVNPTTGDRSTIVIDASFGLGEAVVSGTVTPDHFVVDKVMLEVVEQRIGPKHVEVVADPAGAGTVEREVAPERQGQPALTGDQVRAVAELAKRAERHYGCPQDVEWALHGGEVLLLQSRPETVWSRRPEPARPAAAAPSAPTGLASMAQTLINPLAARSRAHADH
ncbi:MAG TPA: cytochrome P450 [Capillimicrobium sp.]|nr:cytochrome P450 [Capillimicrobium sp.]